MTRETLKIIQRLEDVADPKTKEKLQAERGKEEIGEINDAEVKAEREEEIKALNAQGKLEDVQELQDVVKEHIDASMDKKADGSNKQKPSDTLPETTLISVLAATSKEDAAPTENQDEPAKAEAAAESPADVENDAGELLKAQAVVNDARAAILPISIDDNGLYELLKKKAA